MKAGDRIGMFSYDSGAEGEFYSCTLVKGFAGHLNDIDADLKKRHQVSVAEYEKEFNQQLEMNPDDVSFDLSNDHASFVLSGQKNHRRLYQWN